MIMKKVIRQKYLGWHLRNITVLRHTNQLPVYENSSARLAELRPVCDTSWPEKIRIIITPGDRPSRSQTLTKG